MPRIIGVDIPANKRIDIALRYVYGIGPKIATEIVEKTGIDPATRAKDLDENDLSTIVPVIQEGDYLIEGDLRRELGGCTRCRSFDLGARAHISCIHHHRVDHRHRRTPDQIDEREEKNQTCEAHSKRHARPRSKEDKTNVKRTALYLTDRLTDLFKTISNKNERA